MLSLLQASATMEQPYMLLVTMVVVVFLVLVLLVFLVWAMGRLFISLKEKQKAGKNPQKEPVPFPEAPAVLPAVEEGISDEIVAVIAGAIEAYEAAAGRKGRILSIRSASPSRTRSAWAQAGIVRNTTPFGG